MVTIKCELWLKCEDRGTRKGGVKNTVDIVLSFRCNEGDINVTRASGRELAA
jgi:hypothetical protein